VQKSECRGQIADFTLQISEVKTMSSANLEVGSLRGFTCAICLLHSDFCILTSAL